MAKITIELANDPAPGCPCCDPFAALPQGYVSRDGAPLALYFSDGALAGPVSGAEVTISLGRWDKDSTPEDRRAAAFRIARSGDGTLCVTPFDASLSRWHVLGMLGHMLTAAETQSDPDRDTFRLLVEVIARDDPRIAQALAQPQAPDMRLSLGRQPEQRAFSATAATKG